MASPSCGDSQHSAGPPPLSRKQRRRRAKTLRQRAKRRAAYAAAAAQATEESDTDEEEAAEAARQHEALEAAWKQRDVELQRLFLARQRRKNAQRQLQAELAANSHEKRRKRTEALAIMQAEAAEKLAQRRDKAAMAIQQARQASTVAYENQAARLRAAGLVGTREDHLHCWSYATVGACRHDAACRRVHSVPVAARTVVLRNMYVPPPAEAIRRAVGRSDGTNEGLEVDERAEQLHVNRFFLEAIRLLQSFGAVTTFYVCRNEAPHLHGNVYVEYANTVHAHQAVHALRGKAFRNRMLVPDLVPVSNWDKALCRRFVQGRCPRGSQGCHLLHPYMVSVAPPVSPAAPPSEAGSGATPRSRPSPAAGASRMRASNSRTGSSSARSRSPVRRQRRKECSTVTRTTCADDESEEALRKAALAKMRARRAAGTH